MVGTESVLPVVLAVGLSLIHLFAGRFVFLDAVPRSRWLSGAGGVSIAYVFVHVLPELEERAGAVSALFAVDLLEHHVYLVALVGFTAFYGLERLASESESETESEGTAGGVFWIHVGSFAVYNALIGYLLLHREEPGLRSLLLFAVAMALHFFVNDYGLREHHHGTYERFGRWLLAAAVLGGVAVGSLLAVDEALIGVLFAFLAGGVVLNVIKEELPEERESRFPAFALGAAAYAAVLLLV